MENNKYTLVLNKVALKYKLPVTVVKKIVESQFEFINETTKKMDFSKLQSREEFDELKTNFTVKYLFTLYASYYKIKKINDRINEAKRSNTER